MSDCQNLPQAHFRPSRNAKQSHFYLLKSNMRDTGTVHLDQEPLIIRIDHPIFEKSNQR